MTRTMYDGVDPTKLPRGAQLYAGYDDGRWPDAAAIAAAHPGVPVVRITTDPGDNLGQVLDVESGDATPNQAPAWCARAQLPTVYCSRSAWPGVRQAFANAEEPEPSWWLADYQLSDHPAPPVPPGAVALQYYSGPDYDVSTVSNYWPGIDGLNPPPLPPPAPSPGPALTEETQTMFAHDPVTGGVWATDENGDLYASPPAPFIAGLNQHPTWQAGSAESGGQDPCVGLAYWGVPGHDGITFFTRPSSGVGGWAGTPYNTYSFLRDGTPA